jgi:D-amino-acid oxidase
MGDANCHMYIVTANVPKYLQWLVKTLRSLGGRLERKSFESIQQAIEEFSEATVIVNCTALGSYYLTDVKDHTMYPIRGQTVTVRAPHIKVKLLLRMYNSMPMNTDQQICFYL